MTKELCSGCGDVAAEHPYIGIGKDEDGAFGAFPVCRPCWVDPNHRKVPLKMHFFPRSMRGIALKMAGSDDISGG